MEDSQDDEVQSKFKLAQLWHVVKTAYRSTRANDSHNAVVNNIFKDHFNVNYKVTIKNHSLLTRRNLKDTTALHFVYYDVYDIDTFNTLLERGADFTAKNGQGDTVIHSAISSGNIEMYTEKLTQFIKSVLSAHVKHKNVVNPQNNKGLSHLHAACVINHIDSLKLFLDADGTSVNQATNSDCKLYPAFTPMHFAVHFSSYEAAQILLSHGADVNAKNASGMTPLDECFKNRLSLLPWLNSEANNIKDSHKTYEKKLLKNEKLIKLLLDSKCVSAIGLSRLHVALTLKDLSIAEKLLSLDSVDIDYALPVKSPLRLGWQGYTAAHFAALNSIDAVKMVFRHGSKLETQDAKGESVLDVCLRRFNVQDVHKMLASSDKWKSLCLSDGQTSFLDVVLATASVEQFKEFLKSVDKDIIIPNDSLLWQGYTMLHLAVTTAKTIQKTGREYPVPYNKSFVEECLEVSKNFNLQNAQGESAIHLAYKLGKIDILQLLLKQLDSQEEVEDVIDQDNLSYLHIACAQKNKEVMKKLLQSSDPNVVYKGKNACRYYSLPTGSTPLHVAAYNGSFAIAEMLLEHGANLHAADRNGTTPIHSTIMNCIPRPTDRQVVEALFRKLLENPKDCVHDKIGLSYLHVASFNGHVQAAQKLLELGSDVNAIISSDKKSLPDDLLVFPDLYSTFTPLHLAQANPTTEMIDLLILAGGNVFAKSSNRYSQSMNSNSNIPLEHKNVIRRFMTILWDREDMQKSIEEKLGLTRLHIACYLKNEESVRSVLDSGTFDINAQMHNDSEIFAGCTPLHLLLTISHKITMIVANIAAHLPQHFDQNFEQFTVSPIVQLLLDNNADVTILDAKNNTPIHLFCKYQPYFTDPERCLELLMGAHRDFSVNPANDDGMSHFHIACYRHKADAVEKFLMKGSVDVNRPIDFFAKMHAGSTPLHLALSLQTRNPNWPIVSDIVDLLLQYGADVGAKDVYGDTPLHKEATLHSPEFQIFHKLVSYGANVYSENIKGQSPLDKYSHSANNNGNDFVSLFNMYKYKINRWNRTTGEGNIGKMLLSRGTDATESPEFKELLQSPDITAADEIGRTVIHNSVATAQSFYRDDKNIKSAIGKFIALGIDVNHRDKSGQTALHYAARMENSLGTTALLKYGADIDIVDNNGMTAFSISNENPESIEDRISFASRESPAVVLNLHVQKLLHLRIEVSDINKKMSEATQKAIDRTNSIMPRMLAGKMNLIESFFNQVETSKTVGVGVASLVLFDFLSETNGVTLYPYLSGSERTVVDNFLENLDEKKFDEIRGIVKLQYRKMKARLELVDPAFAALRALLGFSVAGLCEQITRFLLNSELENLIASATV